MELLKIVRRRSFRSEVVYTLLNIALALAIVLIIITTESVLLAIGLILLSKWRVLAVRPRYWFVNIQANLVDFIVSMSLVVFLYTVNISAADQIEKLSVMGVLTVGYIIWLLYLKPRSKRASVITQAGVALFAGTAALFMLSYALPSSVTVLIMWLIGYSTARHSLLSYDETHVQLLSLVWGIILAQLGWLAYHWTVAYSPLGIESVVFPRFALTVLLIGFVAYKAYNSFYHHQKIRTNDVLLPILFTVSIIVVLPLVLNLLGANVTIGI